MSQNETHVSIQHSWRMTLSSIDLSIDLLLDFRDPPAYLAGHLRLSARQHRVDEIVDEGAVKIRIRRMRLIALAFLRPDVQVS